MMMKTAVLIAGTQALWKPADPDKYAFARNPYGTIEDQNLGWKFIYTFDSVKTILFLVRFSAWTTTPTKMEYTTSEAIPNGINKTAHINGNPNIGPYSAWRTTIPQKKTRLLAYIWPKALRADPTSEPISKTIFWKILISLLMHFRACFLKLTHQRARTT
jgi:catalase (peroxidase I)